MQVALAVVTIVVVGGMVGVEFAVAAFVNPIFDRLPGDNGLRARGEGGRILGRVMPFWYLTSLVLAVAWAVMAWGSDGGWAVKAGVALLALSVVMSVAVLVPINSRAVRWAQEGAPPDWREQVRRWDRVHGVRVGVIAMAFALFTVALAQ
ncbi:DUF1772 domain-containing protein [Saccharomonospora sp. NPDC006951]